MTTAVNILWFRQDLRLADNPALSAAMEQGRVLPIYILDDETAADCAMGGASRWWLHHSLHDLDRSLKGNLNLYQGDAAAVINTLCQRFKVEGVYWNRCYEPWRISRDRAIKSDLTDAGIENKSFNASLLNEPWNILKNDSTPYKVFTPYYRQAAAQGDISVALPEPNITSALIRDKNALNLDSLSLLPANGWDSGFYKLWSPGEKGAHASLHRFISEGIHQYKTGRDFPALNSVSKLSPHLHFGEISPRQIMRTVKTLIDDDNVEHFQRELGWREFSYYLLFHWPHLPHQNLKKNFDAFPWESNPEGLQRWQQGKTGYPIIDAGMRELWQTGFMHNRVRMITASFLVKNLLIDWRQGERWFWDCLLDADLASNSASWQWVAGCGTDAAPYFRIFNPVTQGEKFDSEGEYTKHFVPELKDLPSKYLFKPWEAPAEVLSRANVKLGDNYPFPIVDIKESRQRALGAYELTKSSVKASLAD